MQWPFASSMLFALLSLLFKIMLVQKKNWTQSLKMMCSRPGSDTKWGSFLNSTWVSVFSSVEWEWL